MKLYSSPLSPFSAKVRIALYEKRIPFDSIEVPWTPARGWASKPAEMLAINPKGQVPTLVDGELTLYDSTIIFEYLEEQYPNPPLYPRSVADRVRCRVLEDMGDTIIAADAVPLVNEIFKKPDPATRDQAAINAAAASLLRDYERLDKELARRECLCSDFSVADISCFIPINVASYLGVAPAQSLGNLTPWLSRVRERPSVQRDLQEVAGALAKLAA